VFCSKFRAALAAHKELQARRFGKFRKKKDTLDPFQMQARRAAVERYDTGLVFVEPVELLNFFLSVKLRVENLGQAAPCITIGEGLSRAKGDRKTHE
jgi:hypothetical protein